MVRSAILLVLLASLGCEDDPTFVSMDRDSFAVVEAFVLDAESSPIQNAGIRGIGHGAPCDPPQDPGPVAGEDVTDDTGWVRLGLVAGLSSPGLYCVDLIVTTSGAVATDTVRGFEIEFYKGTPSDTSRLVVRTGI